MDIYTFTTRMEIACWLRRLLKAIAKRADSLRRISRSINRRGSMRMGRMRIRSLLTGGFTFAMKKHCGPSTLRQAVSIALSRQASGGIMNNHFAELGDVCSKAHRVMSSLRCLASLLRKAGAAHQSCEAGVCAQGVK